MRKHIMAAVCTIAAILPVSLAAANRRQSIDEMTDGAEKIVIGSVVSQTSRWTDDSRIYTDYVVTTDVTLKGDEDGTVVVSVPGGIVGDTQMTVSDAPEIKHGERVLLFLKTHQGRFEVFGRDTGKYSAASDEAATTAEQVLEVLERKGGKKLDYKRSLAAQVLINRDAATTTTTSAATATDCYSTSGAKWGTTQATYKIGASVPAAWAASINASTATWNNAGARFAFVNNSTSPNELSYLDLVAKYGSSYSNTYAVTTTWSNTTTNVISKATIEINNRWQWSTSGQANMADVQNIMTHEFGHWLRLGDLYDPAACSETTMWGTAALGETKKRSLDQADVNGFASLYGRTGTITAPVLAAPANGATAIPTTPTLTWNTASGATSYDVYFGTATSPALVATVATTTYQPGTLALGTKYYWRVVAKNSSGSATSATWSFTTGTTAIAAPVLVAPANGAAGVSTTPTMRWNAVTGASGYDIYVGTSAASLSYIGRTTYTSVQISGFARSTLYYWKIVARNSAGATASSAVWSFRTY